MNNYIIREMNPNESEILKEMLYQAIFQPDETKLVSKAIIKQPELSIYIENWGKKDDICFVALVDDKIIGAVWTRIFLEEIKGFGNIDNETPELSISLYKEYRNQGIGTDLMIYILNKLKKCGYKQVSLSVQKENYAVKMYQNVGFKIFKETEEEYLMIHKLNS